MADLAADAGSSALLLPRGFFKGQLHAHSSASDDSQTPPEDVRRWYEARGYDFVVFTDHNAITRVPAVAGARTVTFPGVELTRNLTRCTPPERTGGCSLHTNALFVEAPSGKIDLGDIKGAARRDVYEGEVARARALGGLAMLCHPNLLGNGPDESTLVDLARQGLRLFELRNEAWDSENEGGAERPSTEALWDGALSRGARIFATATDDAHHYADAERLRATGERPFDGDRGFVVVRASDKSGTSLRAALANGDFYASTGLVFTTHERTPTTLTLETAEPATFEVIHERGVVTSREDGRRLEARLTPADGRYLRVRARRANGAMAWTQPLFAPTAR